MERSNLRVASAESSSRLISSIGMWVTSDLREMFTEREAHVSHGSRRRHLLSRHVPRPVRKRVIVEPLVGPSETEGDDPSSDSLATAVQG